MLRQLGAAILSSAITIGIVFGLTRLLRFDRDPPRFRDPRRAALWSLVAVAIGWVCLSAVLFSFAHPDSTAPAESEITPRESGVNDLVSVLVLSLISFGPIVVFLRVQRQSWASAGVTRRNLRGASVVGWSLGALATAAAVTLQDAGPREVLAGLGVSHVWGFLYFAVVGFSEEFAYRGYLQTRLCAWLGWWQGWVAASVLMALAHVVQRTTVMGMAPAAALASSVSLVPISFVMGFVMLRTRNVVAPGLLHTFANWVGTLG